MLLRVGPCPSSPHLPNVRSLSQTNLSKYVWKCVLCGGVNIAKDELHSMELAVGVGVGDQLRLLAWHHAEHRADCT